MRSLLFATLSLALLGCGQQQAAAPAVDSRVPEWARSYIGQNFAETFPRINTDCIGSVDSVVERYADGGVRIQGWSWDRAGRAAYAHILAVSSAGLIHGMNTATSQRPDVVTARADIVITPNVGYELRTLDPAAPSAVYGVDTNAHAACRLGDIPL